ncbi:P-type ATPase (P-ATPase) Superfamily Protein [Monocercomonoides exilis]|uniref:P-type ATPase (P-ATPase) Superfamily Protein n=1 Tax=Monocercomonoides exilis TaxID=2049356 RepID=UPI003559E3C5|nr:P-type ATPase (P-ATPase) Superfamily Protein [Monocercomonoides exilis]|eukprot:MONOS_10793.1-p1 / transcript=MONOS_10793.1 / gene=MONOS_10793 / organism=Monocercomonoides_exilis_PA203 / gene_product=P-type ATPase (P-ATPase) Superfamily Protein / transcript_product=P-type ATPase (P-ATPase) Superfamily Protein / location=Mono_scaffold00505:22671-26785(-) / protein_length=1323 / sequence_SO=supercontig / SO=protein_coding / is_pseudo=false
MSNDWIKPEVLERLMQSGDKSMLKRIGGVEQLLKSLHSSNEGISNDKEDIESRQARFGKNEFLTPQPKKWISLWLESFEDHTLIILMILAVVSLVIAFVFERDEKLAWVDGAAILMTVFAVTIVSSLNTWTQEQQFRSLNDKQQERTIMVIRNGEPIEIFVASLCVGDIVILRPGEKIPADGICIESFSLQCNESAMTGDSDLIPKDVLDSPFLFCGCTIQTGYGKMVVTAVGMKTQFGIVKKSIMEQSQERKPTALQTKLGTLADQIGNLGFISAGITLVLLGIFWGFALWKNPAIWDHGRYMKVLLDYVIVAVTIVVVAVPEGLPLAVTISLAYSIKKMLKDNNLVRRLESCETMGCATVICSDKTGTLTQNCMRVSSGWFEGRMWNTTKANGDDNTFESNLNRADNLFTSSPSSSPSQKVNLSSYYLSLLSEAISLNSTAELRIQDEAYDQTWMEDSQDSRDTKNTHRLNSSLTSSSSSSNGHTQHKHINEDEEPLISSSSQSHSSFGADSESSAFGKNANEHVEHLGNVTECALLHLLRDCGCDYRQERKDKEDDVLEMFPFNSETKLMTVVLKKTEASSPQNQMSTPTLDDKMENTVEREQKKGKKDEKKTKLNGMKSSLSRTFRRVIVKGAPEAVLANCTQFADVPSQKEDYSNELNVKQMSADDRHRFAQLVAKMSSDGLRTIAIAIYDDKTSIENAGKVGNDDAADDESEAYNQILEHHHMKKVTPQKNQRSQHSLSPQNSSSSSSPLRNSEKGDDDTFCYPSSTPTGQEYIHNLTLIAIAGIKDPLRPEVSEAIRECKEASIAVKMVTGDNIHTAISIAKDCGIYSADDVPEVENDAYSSTAVSPLSDGMSPYSTDTAEDVARMTKVRERIKRCLKKQKEIALTGYEYRHLTDKERMKVLPLLKILARSSPMDKLLIVSDLQKAGEIVSVTGDGTNDSAALAQADVGMAMGITGTEVAKEASAIVITDDNFASIVKAVVWGRNIYESVRKFIQFQLTVNLVAITVSVIGAIFAITPLKAVQMLWVNLIMDTLAALALATESPTKEELLKRKPNGKNKSIINSYMKRNVVAGVAYEMLVMLFVLFAWGKEDFEYQSSVDGSESLKILHCEPSELIESSPFLFPGGLCRRFLLDSSVHIFSVEHLSFVFNTFIWLQLFNEISCRRCNNDTNFFRHILQDKLFLLIECVTSIIQVCVMLIPPLSTVFAVCNLSPSLWVWSLVLAVGIIPVQFVVRSLVKCKEDSGSGDDREDADRAMANPRDCRDGRTENRAKTERGKANKVDRELIPEGEMMSLEPAAEDELMMLPVRKSPKKIS